MKDIELWVGKGQPAPTPSDNEVADLIRLVPEHKSANLVVDVGNTCLFAPSVLAGPTISPASGATVGNIVDMLHANTFTNVWVLAGATSGPIALLIQTADAASGLTQSGSLQATVTSGSFTDPTSGLAQLPTNVNSGGVIWVNSGLYSLPGGGGASGGQNINTFPLTTNPIFQGMVPQGGSFPTSGNATVCGSGGGMAFAAFQRPQRYARLILLSGVSTSPVYAGFLANLKTTGSGGGFTFSPGSGNVVV